MAQHNAYPPFLGPLPEPIDPSRASASIIPVPYDETSTWKKGADRGPAAILDASGTVELYDIETGTEPWRRGIVTCAPVQYSGDPSGLADKVDQVVSAELALGRLPVVLGGEHSVSIGAIRAVHRRVPGLSVLQIDAHADTRETYEGSPFNHACVMARAREWCPVVQVGIRAIDSAEAPKLDPKRTFYGWQIAGNPDRSWMDRAIELLSADVYVTIDLDGFDPSLVPATGTPEPGGLFWPEVMDFLSRLTARRRVAAFDVVELLPMTGHHASNFVAAKLVHRLLAMVLAKRA